MCQPLRELTSAWAIKAISLDSAAKKARCAERGQGALPPSFPSGSDLRFGRVLL